MKRKGGAVYREGEGGGNKEDEGGEKGKIKR